MGFDLLAILGALGVALAYAGTANQLVGLEGTARSLMQWARHWESVPPSSEEQELQRIASAASLVQQKVLSRIVGVAVLAVAVTLGVVKLTDEVAKYDKVEVVVDGLAVVVTSSPAVAILRRVGPVLDEDEKTILKAYGRRYKRFVASEASKLGPLSDSERLVLDELKQRQSSVESLWDAVGRRNDPSLPTKQQIEGAVEDLNRTGDIQLIQGPAKKLKQDCRITPKGLGRLADDESQRSRPPD